MLNQKIGSLFIFFSLIMGSQLFAQTVNNSSAKIYEPILNQLQQKTKVPLRLPKDLAAEEETNQLYAIVEKAETNFYEIQIAFTPDCDGGTACHYESFFGKNISTKSIKSNGVKVKLKKGKAGYFTNASCGANCSDSILSWEEGDYRYTVALKAGSLKTLTRIANSAIE